jgi:serine/threonine protein kinase
MNLDTSENDPIDTLAEEFLDQHRRGERPTVDEYAARNPELSSRIRDLFPALLALEKFTPALGTFLGGWPDRLGDFRIVREVGRGGMGVVFEAVQESLGRTVALKVLPQSFGRRADAAERFRREARTAANLHHTNIVPVFGVGEWQGTLYYAMQFIRGRGLDAIVREKHHQCCESTRIEQVGSTPPAESGFPTLGIGSDKPSREPSPHTLLPELNDRDWHRTVARLGVQVTEALAYAHTHGVLHRDVKPSNLLLDDQGTAWVTDFGLAKAAGVDDLTSTGNFVGTMRYLAPERFRGESDARSDVYSLGATLYELLTLRPVFATMERPQLVEQITHGGPVPPRRFDPAIPADLETVILKTLARDPGHRYASAADLGDDLRNFLADRPLKARRVTRLERGWRWCRHNQVVAGLAAALAVLLPAALAIMSVLFWKAEQQRKLADENARQAAIAAATADEKSTLARATVDEMLTTLGSRLSGTTDIPRVRKEMYGRALELYKRFAAEPGGDARVIRLGLAKNYGRLGRIDRDLGQFTEARDELGRAESILSALALEQPDDTVVGQEMVFTVQALAGLLRKTGDRPGAVSAYRRVADLEAHRAGISPDETADRYTNALNSLAVALWENGESAEALVTLRDCVAQSRRRLTAAPESRGLQAGLAMRLMNLGLLLDEAKHYEAAAVNCREAVAVYEALVAADATGVDARVGLANGIDNYGLILRHQGRLEDSANVLRRSREMRATLARDFPDLPAFRFQLAQAHSSLASVLTSAGRAEEASRELAASIPQLERLAADFPSALEYQVHLAVAYTNRGAISLLAGRPADALADGDHAVALIDARTDSIVTNAENRQQVAECHAGRAVALAALRRHAEAAKAWDRAVSFATDRQEIRVNRAKAVAHAGDLVAAIREADELARTGGLTPEQLCGLAGVYAVVAGQYLDDSAHSDSLAATAVELLRQAVKKGYQGRARLQNDPDLITLGHRTDFAALLTELADRSPKKTER